MLTGSNCTRICQQAFAEKATIYGSKFYETNPDHGYKIPALAHPLVPGPRGGVAGLGGLLLSGVMHARESPSIPVASKKRSVTI